MARVLPRPHEADRTARSFGDREERRESLASRVVVPAGAERSPDHAGRAGLVGLDREIGREGGGDRRAPAAVPPGPVSLSESGHLTFGTGLADNPVMTATPSAASKPEDHGIRQTSRTLPATLPRPSPRADVPRFAQLLRHLRRVAAPHACVSDS